MINWEQYRRADGSIDLTQAASAVALRGAGVFSNVELTSRQRVFLEHVEALTPIKSTQVAALALTQALML